MKQILRTTLFAAWAITMILLGASAAQSACSVTASCCTAETSCPRNNPTCECRYICDDNQMGCECWCEGKASPAFWPIDGDGAFIGGSFGREAGEVVTLEAGAEALTLRIPVPGAPLWEVADRMGVKVGGRLAQRFVPCGTISGDRAFVLYAVADRVRTRIRLDRHGDLEFQDREVRP